MTVDSDDLGPVQGISLEAWAATNAVVAAGASLTDLLRGQGISQASWDDACAEWNARLARDTTSTIVTRYRSAFSCAATGKYARLAREATAARRANRDLTSPLPMTIEAYFAIVCESSIACRRGGDPQSVLRELGLTVADWTSLCVVMGYHIERSYQGDRRDHVREAMSRVLADVEARYAEDTARREVHHEVAARDQAGVDPRLGGRTAQR